MLNWGQIHGNLSRVRVQWAGAVERVGWDNGAAEHQQWSGQNDFWCWEDFKNVTKLRARYTIMERTAINFSHWNELTIFLSNFKKSVVPLSLKCHTLWPVIIKGGGGRGRHTSSQCCLTLFILPALPLAISNYVKGFGRKSDLVYVEHLFTLLHFHKTFYRQCGAFSRSFNSYILAVKDAGFSATYQKQQM